MGSALTSGTSAGPGLGSHKPYDPPTGQTSESSQSAVLRPDLAHKHILLSFCFVLLCFLIVVKTRIPCNLPPYPFLNTQFIGIKCSHSLCSHHPRSSPELFHLSIWKLCPHTDPHLPSPSPWQPPFYFNVAMTLKTLGTSHEWNHTELFSF